MARTGKHLLMKTMPLTKCSYLVLHSPTTPKRGDLSTVIYMVPCTIPSSTILIATSRVFHNLSDNCWTWLSTAGHDRVLSTSLLQESFNAWKTITYRAIETKKTYQNLCVIHLNPKQSQCDVTPCCVTLTMCLRMLSAVEAPGRGS